MSPKKKPPKTREEILEQKRIAERLRYQRLKNDPQKKEELKEKERQKYRKKKEKGKRKLVKDMSRREHKAVKKVWREHSSKYRAKKKVMKDITNNFARENTSDSEDPAEERQAPLRSSESALVKARKKNAKQKRERALKEKDLEIQGYKRKMEKYKKRLQRLEMKVNSSKNEETPNTKLTRMCDTPETRTDLVKKALFGEVLNKQLKENYAGLRTQKEKDIFGRVVSGAIVKKYKLWRVQNSAISYKRLQKSKNHSLLPVKRTRQAFISKEHLKTVQNFYDNDDNSRICAGKRECVTRNGVKKQKRYLLDTISNLYKKFWNNNSGLISYQTFCRLRPFWVVAPKINERDTCLCIKHANIDLKLTALHCRKILPYNNYNKLLENTCCNRYDEQCLSRECLRCVNKNPDYQEFDDTKPISFKKWIAEKQDYKDPKLNKVRSITKYVKKSLTVRPRELIQELHEELDEYYRHERNILHQYKALKELKENLNDNEVAILMDFSENYCTKYNKEIQAYHFGGSRLQLSLHTVVVYTKDSTKSYCTISQNTAHSPAAIWEHLKPIFKTLSTHITCIHFISDGPVTQYRNKTMFHILATRLHVEVPNIQKFSWNFSESGHGKSAADGVGATCKRTADAIVAAGGDIDSLESFIESVQQRCPAITMFAIDNDAINNMSNDIQKDAKSLKSFNGTLKIHQIKGKISRCPLGLPKGAEKLIMKSLSCSCEEECQHFNLGVINYQVTKLHVDDVYTDSESESETRLAQNSPDSNIIIENEISRPCDIINTDFENSAGPSTISQQQYNSGDYVLVKFNVRNTEYRYAAVITQVDNEEGELTVTFMKICDKKGHKFKMDENDISDVSFDQILQKLPDPDLSLKGRTLFYYFPVSVPVFQKN